MVGTVSGFSSVGLFETDLFCTVLAVKEDVA
jgi:hypothetical protein